MIFKHDKMFEKKKKTAQLWLVLKDLKPTLKIYKNILPLSHFVCPVWKVKIFKEILFIILFTF